MISMLWLMSMGNLIYQIILLKIFYLSSHHWEKKEQVQLKYPSNNICHCNNSRTRNVSVVLQ